MNRPLGASVRGVAAVWAWRRLAPELEDSCRAQELRGRPDVARALRSMMADLAEASEQWQAWAEAQPGSASGTAEPGLAERVPGSSAMAEISTAAAAELLGVSARRVTALLQQGLLEGRRVGRAWLVSRRSVLEHRESRRAA